MKSWKPRYMITVAPIVGILSASVATVLIFSAEIVGDAIHVGLGFLFSCTLVLFFFGGLMGLLVGRLFSVVGATAGRKVHSEGGESAGSLIGWFLGAILGGVAGIFLSIAIALFLGG